MGRKGEGRDSGDGQRRLKDSAGQGMKVGGGGEGHSSKPKTLVVSQGHWCLERATVDSDLDIKHPHSLLSSHTWTPAVSAGTGPFWCLNGFPTSTDVSGS